MAVPIFQVVFFVGGTALAWKNGYIEKMLQKIQDKPEVSKNSQHNLQQNVKPQAPIIVQTPVHKEAGSVIIPMLGISSLIALGYLYYSNSLGTKKVINKVESTGKQTQGLVKMTDENNLKRFSELDKRNDKRGKEMEAEIRSETRAGFQVVSEQLYCLTQVCIQTLSALGNGSSDDTNGEFCQKNQKLLGYAHKAQDMADTILDDTNMLKAKQHNLKEIKAEIYHRNEEEFMQNSNDNNNIYNTPGYVNNNKDTPGDNDDIHNYNELNKQKPFITNYGDGNNSNNNINNNNNVNSNIKYGMLTSKIWHSIKPFISKVLPNTTNNIDNNGDVKTSFDQKLKIGGSISVLLGAYALYQYWPNNSDDYQNGIQIQYR